MSKDAFTNFFYSGTSGLALPFNKSHYPAEFKDKSRLEYYASMFNSIEFNSTFYKLPKISTVNNWAESVPKDFRFTFKVPKAITHSPELKFEISDITDFMNVVDNVGNKKGCLLAQFPPSVTTEHIEPFKGLFETFKHQAKESSWKLAMEFRHSSWYQPQVYELLNSYNASLVLHDLKNSGTQFTHPDTDIVYLRFHGPEPRYRGTYSDGFLKQRAESIVNWIEEGKNVYAYFNNTMGDAFANLQTLNNYVKELQ